MKIEEAAIAGLVGIGLGAGVYALIAGKETPSAVAWAGNAHDTTMQSAIVDVLDKRGIRLSDGNLKQEITPDGMSVLLVRPSDLAIARGLIETLRPR